MAVNDCDDSYFFSIRIRYEMSRLMQYQDNVPQLPFALLVRHQEKTHSNMKARLVAVRTVHRPQIEWKRVE